MPNALCMQCADESKRHPFSCLLPRDNRLMRTCPIRNPSHKFFVSNQEEEDESITMLCRKNLINYANVKALQDAGTN